MRHLLNDTMLDEYLGSPRRGRAVLNHVRQCPDCQAKAREGRLLRLLLHKPADNPPGDHLDTQTLASFSEEKLNDYQTIQVMEHLAQCELCLASFRQLHQALAESAQQVAGEWVDAALAAFVSIAKRPESWGRLVIEEGLGGFQLNLEPEVGQATGLMSDLASISPSMDLEQFDQPLFASQSDEPGLERMQSSPAVASRTVPPTLTANREQRTDPVVIDAGHHRITVVDHVREKRHELEVRVEGDPEPYETTLVTLGGESVQRGVVGEAGYIALPADVLALRFSGEAFTQPIELELKMPRSEATSK